MFYSLLAGHFPKTVRYSKLSPSGIHVNVFRIGVLELRISAPPWFLQCHLLRCVLFKDASLECLTITKRSHSKNYFCMILFLMYCLIYITVLYKIITNWSDTRQLSHTYRSFIFLLHTITNVSITHCTQSQMLYSFSHHLNYFIEVYKGQRNIILGDGT